MKPLFCALALALSLAPAIADEAATASAPAIQTVAKSVTLSSGLIVTPVAVPFDALRSMLDVQMWRFNVKPSTPNTFFQMQLEVRTTGEETGDKIRKENAFGFLIEDETEVTLGLLPKGGSTFANAEYWRVHFSGRRLSGEPFFTPTNGDIVNPIKDLKWERGEESGDGQIYNSSYPAPNGDIVLQTYFGGTAEKPVVTKLVLVLTAKTPTSK